MLGSRRVVGYAISHSITMRASLLLRSRPPSAPAIHDRVAHHSDRGRKYASETYRAVLREHGLVGSMARRGKSYDNAKAESFMKTLKSKPYI